MKKIIILIAVFTISASLKAQDSKIRLGIEYSIDDISGETFVYQGDGFINQRNERDEFNYTLGLTSTFLTNSNFSFKTGLMYSNKDYKTNFFCATCLSIYIPDPELIKQRFISIPFQISYRASNKKLSPFFEFGLVINFGVSDNEYDFIKENFLEGQLGFGLAYSISNQLDVELGYQYRNAFSAIYDNSISSSNEDNDPNKLNTKGFKLRLNYRF